MNCLEALGGEVYNAVSKVCSTGLHKTRIFTKDGKLKPTESTDMCVGGPAASLHYETQLGAFPPKQCHLSSSSVYFRPLLFDSIALLTDDRPDCYRPRPYHILLLRSADFYEIARQYGPAGSQGLVTVKWHKLRDTLADQLPKG
jgi:hypothetical protein